MASLFSKVSEFARSPKGRELTDRAKRAAKDPENRRKLEELRGRIGKKR